MTSVQKRGLILALVLLGAVAFLYPTLHIVGKQLSGGEVTDTDRNWENWVSKPVSLGLDLSGGVQLVYRVLADEAVKNRLLVSANTIRTELRAQKVPVRVNVTDREIQFIVHSERSAAKVKELIDGDSTYRFDFLGQRPSSGGKIEVAYGISEQGAQLIRSGAISQAVETLRTRVDQFGVSEPLIQRLGEDRINLQMPGAKDVETVKRVIGRVAKLEFRFLPRPNNPGGTVRLKSKDGGEVVVEDTVQLGGDAIEGARVGFDPAGKVEVLLQLTREGGKTFGKITGSNVGRQLAIILDGVVYSSPEIQGRIPNGECVISGSFTLEEANQLAVVLKAGALPAPLEVLQERTVGPTLGQESIRKGITAIGVGFVLILAFMVVYYKKSGLVASGILLLNIVLVLAALSAFGATLTLPGLAGLALTVGMAVDANVIIFERIKEELQRGVGRDVAVEEGFGKAFSAIIDANVTSLITGLILYYFGTGPVRGFAVTLSVGILTTIFCATFVAKLAFDYFPMRSSKGLSV